jgi:hypothetical protein
MFNLNYSSIYEDSDDFGVQEYRENLDVLFEMNSVTVKLIKSTTQQKDNLEGDFLGIKTKQNKDSEKMIKISLSTREPKAKKMSEEGYHGRGKVRINAFCRYDVNIDDACMIEFLEDYKYGIKRGDLFRVEIKDTGNVKGQFTFQNFDLLQVN